MSTRPGRRTRASDPTKALERMTAKMSAGEFYEAQQLVMSLVRRYKSKGDSSAAYSVLIGAISKLLEHKQLRSATDLGILYIKTLEEFSNEYTPEVEDSILNLHGQFPEDDSDGLHVEFMKAAIRWSVGVSGFKQGAPGLHGALAIRLASEEQYGDAQYHFVRSREVASFSDTLCKWASKGYRGERDLFITRAVLHYLALSNLKDANMIKDSFCSRMADMDDTPLLHFVTFLLQTLERDDAFPLMQMLRKKYKPSLSRDKEFEGLLDQIAKVFYNARPGGGGLFGGLMRAMMSGGSS